MTWPVTSIGSVCEVISGATPQTGNAAFWGGDVPWVTPKDLSDLGQKYLRDTPRKLTEVGLQSCSARMLPPHSVLLSSRAPIGLVAINTLPVCTNQGFKSLVPRDRTLSAEFLYWWLKSHEGLIQSKGRGATFKEVSKKIVEDLQIPLPPIVEQKRIAQTLDAADELRATRREALADLDTLVQSIFLDMFGDPVTNPKRWDVVDLGQVTTRITKGESPKWQGFEYQDDGALFVTSENVRQGVIDISSPKYIPIDFHQKLSRSQLGAGNLLVNLVGASIGRSCLFPGFDRPANVNQAVAVVTPGGKIESTFLAGLLNTGQGQRMLLGNRVEAARANISLTNLRDLKIILPPIELQRRFAAIVDLLKKQEERQREHLAELDALFASLQSRAFNGEL